MKIKVPEIYEDKVKSLEIEKVERLFMYGLMMLKEEERIVLQNIDNQEIEKHRIALKRLEEKIGKMENEEENKLLEKYKEGSNYGRKQTEIEMKHELDYLKKYRDEMAENLKKALEDREDEIQKRVKYIEGFYKKELENKSKELEIRNKEYSDLCKISLDNKEQSNKMENLLTLFSERYRIDNNAKARVGEMYIEKLLHEYFRTAEIEITRAKAEESDIFFKWENLIMIIESKNKKAIRADEVEKFRRDINTMKNKINCAIFVSMEDITLVKSFREFYFEMINEIPTLYLGGIMDKPYILIYSVLLMKSIISNSILKEQYEDKNYIETLSSIINHYINLITTSKSTLNNLESTHEGIKKTIDKLQKDIVKACNSIDNIFTLHPELRKLEKLEYTKPNEISKEHVIKIGKEIYEKNKDINFKLMAENENEHFVTKAIIRKYFKNCTMFKEAILES